MSTKTVTLKINVWYDSEKREITLAGDGLTATTVNNNPNSERCHRNLYSKLSKILRDAGAPATALRGADA